MLPNRTVNVVEYQMPDHIDWIGVKFISDFSSSSTDVSPQTSGDANQNNADVNIDASDSLFSSFVHDRSTATVPNAEDRPGEAIALQDNAVAHEDHAGSPNSFNDRTNEIPAAQNA